MNQAFFHLSQPRQRWTFLGSKRQIIYTISTFDTQKYHKNQWHHELALKSCPRYGIWGETCTIKVSEFHLSGSQKLEDFIDIITGLRAQELGMRMSELHTWYFIK